MQELTSYWREVAGMIMKFLYLNYSIVLVLLYFTSLLSTQLEESADWRKRTSTWHPNLWPTL